MKWFKINKGLHLNICEKELLNQCIISNIESLVLNEYFDPEELAQTLQNLDKLKEKIKGKNKMITFIEHEHAGYALRTRDNTLLSDATLAFACDFKSPGMVLTHKATYGVGKPFIRIDLNEYEVMTERDALGIAAQLMDHNVKVLNIAGNSMPHLRSKYTQEGIKAKVADCMNKIHAFWPIESIRTGGQGGVDLAGSIWAEGIGMDSTVLAPKGWMFRSDGGRDICNEYEFIKRFPGYSMEDIF